jgi:outer membrane phospholipase A
VRGFCRLILVASTVLAMEPVGRAQTVDAPAPKDELVRPAGAPPRTAVPEAVSSDVARQYFFLHNDNFFALRANEGWPAEAKFQVSVRFEMLSFFEKNNLALNAAYTQTSYWEIFDTARSEPVVENNYSPEAFLSYRPYRSQRYRELQAGYLHDSNGLGDVDNVNQTANSKGWNTFFAEGRWGFSRAASSQPWFFPTVGARGWVPFFYSKDLNKQLGYGEVFLDLDLSVPKHERYGRFSSRSIVRMHSIQEDLYYGLPAASQGVLRAWLFGQLYYGEGESLSTAAQTARHVYFGLAFQ